MFIPSPRPHGVRLTSLNSLKDIMVIIITITSGMTSLKLIERKVPKEKIAMLSIPMIPVKIIITIFLTRHHC